MAIDRGHGIATSAVLADSYDLDALIADTEAAKVAAELAETNASTSETNAAASATSASSSATTATTQASNASTSATNAATSATNAATSETNAATSETNAATSATNAATSATNAATSETNTENLFDTFDDRFLGTKTSDPTLDNDGDALLEGAMYYNSTANDIRFYNGVSWDAPATDAATSATNAAISETNAATSATNAATSETNAASSASSASTSATTATTQASAAATSASNAATSETNASTSATSASTSATNAATSATAASTAQTAAETAQAAAELALDNFDDTYLGAKASDPTLDNDGDALTEGDMYFNTTTDIMKVYDGAAWNNVALDASTVVTKTSTTGSAELPVGTTAQRDGTPSAGYMRFNTTDSSAEIYDGSAWGAVGGGATGGGSDDVFYENAQTVTASYTLTTNKNAMSAGPLTINTGVTVTVPTGATWHVL